MLSSVLNSERAIHVNIQIMRTFTRLREMISANKELARKLVELEKKVGKHDHHIALLFEAIKKLMEPLPVKDKRIGFSAN